MAKKRQVSNATLNELVISEAKKLKKNATLDEIKRLDFERLCTDSPTSCIYGQMTKLSCKRVIERDDDMNGINGTLNGSPLESFRSEYWSPIEVFIDRLRNNTNGNNERLIKFLKGETKTLTLK